MTAGAATDLARARASSSACAPDYGYTLELPQQEVADPLADFLFMRRKGYCEYFASAMAVMLRTLGIPSRLVTGFQMGVYNPISDLWVVRASDAHSWVEAWIPGLRLGHFRSHAAGSVAPSVHALVQGRLIPGCRRDFLAAMGGGLRSQPPGHPGRPRPTGGPASRDRLVRLVVRSGVGMGRAGQGLDPAVRVGRSVGAAGGVLACGRAVRGYGVRYGCVARWCACAAARPAWPMPRCSTSACCWCSGGGGTRNPHGLPRWNSRARCRPRRWDARSKNLPAAYNALRFGGRIEAAPRLSTLLNELERPGRST